MIKKFNFEILISFIIKSEWFSYSIYDVEKSTYLYSEVCLNLVIYSASKNHTNHFVSIFNWLMIIIIIMIILFKILLSAEQVQDEKASLFNAQPKYIVPRITMPKIKKTSATNGNTFHLNYGLGLGVENKRLYLHNAENVS